MGAIGECYVTLKWFWWLGKYGHTYPEGGPTENEQGETVSDGLNERTQYAARKSLESANAVASGYDQRKQAKLMADWQKAWAVDGPQSARGGGAAKPVEPPVPPRKGDPGTTFVDIPEEDTEKEVNKYLLPWPRLFTPAWLGMVNPCCKLQELIHEQGHGVFLSIETGSSENAALMILAVDCDEKNPKGDCEVVVMDWREGAGKAKVKFSKTPGKSSISIDKTESGMEGPGGYPPQGAPFGAGKTHAIASLSIHT